jgi:exonuclease III
LERTNGLRLGILNIGTFLDKAEEVVELMKKRNIDILGLSETRDKILGRKIIHENYVYISSGEKSGKHGVGIVVNENTGKYITDFENVNNRIMKINIKTKHQRLAIIQIMHHS